MPPRILHGKDAHAWQTNTKRQKSHAKSENQIFEAPKRTFRVPKSLSHSPKHIITPPIHSTSLSHSTLPLTSLSSSLGCQTKSNQPQTLPLSAIEEKKQGKEV